MRWNCDATTGELRLKGILTCCRISRVVPGALPTFRDGNGALTLPENLMNSRDRKMCDGSGRYIVAAFSQRENLVGMASIDDGEPYPDVYCAFIGVSVRHRGTSLWGPRPVHWRSVQARGKDSVISRIATCSDHSRYHRSSSP